MGVVKYKYNKKPRKKRNKKTRKKPEKIKKNEKKNSEKVNFATKVDLKKILARFSLIMPLGPDSSSIVNNENSVVRSIMSRTFEVS